MRVVLSAIGTFHTFDMARQLEAAGALGCVFTGYPRFKLRSSGVPQDKIRSFPWLHGPYMAGWIPNRLKFDWEYWDRRFFDSYVAAALPAQCDLFCGLSGSAISTGLAAKRRGLPYVCDRGSSHIRFQDTILRQEHERWRMPYPGIDPRIVAREEREYELADVILVPSQFALRTFVDSGVPREKLRLAPYGVDTARFSPVAKPAEDAFDILFVGGLSLRKGVRYLFDGFEKLTHPRKTLTVAGTVAPEIASLVRDFAARSGKLRLLGHVPQAELKSVMSRAHVLALPSVEEGFGLVQAQAMACGCPVIASSNTGAADLFRDGIEGFIVAPQDADGLCAALQKLADDPSLRARLSAAALQRVAWLGGWNRYGQVVLDVFRSLTGRDTSVSPQAATAS